MMVTGGVKQKSASRGRVMAILLASLLTAVLLAGYYFGQSLVAP